MIRRTVPLALLIVVAGCTEAPGTYPSLALRPIESRPEAEVAPTVTPATPDPALDTKIAGLTGDLTKADAAFAAQAEKAERAARVPGAGNVGSDAWVGAQAATADLESTRDDARAAMLDLEKLVLDRGQSGAPPYPALDDAYAKAQATDAAEATRVQTIKALMGEK